MKICTKVVIPIGIGLRDSSNSWINFGYRNVSLYTMRSVPSSIRAEDIFHRKKLAKEDDATQGTRKPSKHQFNEHTPSYNCINKIKSQIRTKTMEKINP